MIRVYLFSCGMAVWHGRRRVSVRAFSVSSEAILADVRGL